MKTNIDKKSGIFSKFWLIIGVLILILVSAITLFILERNNVTHIIPGVTPDPTVLKQQDTQTQVDIEKKKDAIENTNTTTNPQAIDHHIELSAQQQNSEVTIFTKLYNYSDGSCSISITNDTSTFTNNAEIIYQPEYSTCAGFSVPVSKLGSGTWNVTLVSTSTSNTQTDSKTIIFKVN
jgi:hypothetical protein